MSNKYFTVSFDDGLEQDKKIIVLMKKYGIQGTFNLNSGLVGTRKQIGHIGNIGFKIYPETQEKTILKKTNLFRIPIEEIKEVYKDFEVATHGYMHENLLKLSSKEIKDSILIDMQKLSNIVDYQVNGHAYPFGQTNENVKIILSDIGIKYARTIKSKASFEFPKNLLEFNPTCWIAQKNVEDLLNTFLKNENSTKNEVFCLWGHGYEMDYNTKLCNWDRLENIFKMVSENKDVECVQNRELINRI